MFWGDIYNTASFLHLISFSLNYIYHVRYCETSFSSGLP